ncbi:MAG: alanine racemase [Sphingobacteriaceae bacterium]|nr:alanine racemase [Sphingobacteriaceae bacterium]
MQFEIDLNKLTHNVNHYRSLIGKQTQLMCMVKAMGYGAEAKWQKPCNTLA